jgi:hypothetical protein
MTTVNPLPILTLNLLDIKLPANSRLMSAFLNGMREIARENKELFETHEIPTDIFHNDNIAYSGIQFTTVKQAVCITAIGYKEVKALELWYDLFLQNTGNTVQNTVITREQYVGMIANDYYGYRIDSILLKSEIGREIEQLNNHFAVKDRLEKYLYGNIKAFLVRVAGMQIDDNNFISVKVANYKNRGLKPTFHGGKLPAFDIRFAVNVYLPHTLRLGQAISLGYGSVFHDE